MKDLLSLMQLAFRLAHELSEACLDLERLPALAGREYYAAQLADCGVSALAHVAAASSSYGGDYRDRREAYGSLRGASGCVARLMELLRTLNLHHYVPSDRAHELMELAQELRALLMALALEIKGLRAAA